MEEPSLRIRIVFEDTTLLSESMRREGLTQSWVLLTPDMATMADVASHLVDKFGLRGSEIQLTMDDFVLPPFESTCILKSHDILKVRKKGAAQIQVSGECFHEGESSKKELSKKHRKSNDLDSCAEPNSNLDGRIVELPSSVPANERNDEPGETILCSPHAMYKPKQSRNARRKKERREQLKMLFSTIRKNCPSEQQMNGSHYVSKEHEDGILKPEMQEAAFIGVRPGGNLHHSRGSMETHQCNAAYSSKRRKWGAENTTGNENTDGSYKLNFKVNNVGEGSNMNEKSINDGWRSSTNFSGWKNTGKSIAGCWKNSKDGTGGG